VIIPRININIISDVRESNGKIETIGKREMGVVILRRFGG
jgi:hypothetical protein